MITPRTALVVLLVTKLYMCQSIVTAESIAPSSVCADCYIPLATSSGDTFSAAVGMTTFPLGKSRQANGDITGLVLTAYSMTGGYLSNGVCIFISATPVVLAEAYTVTCPSSIPSSDFHAYATSVFHNYLGLPICSEGGENVNSTPLIQVANRSVTPAPSTSLLATANSTTSLTLHSSNATKPIVTPRPDEPTKIGIGISVSFAALIPISLVAFIWRKRRLRSAAITAEDQGNTKNRQEGTSASRGDSQPYLQQKPELEAEEQQIHELEARQKIYELDGETGIIEIPAGTHEHRLAVMRSRQELRGGEHSQELDT